MYAEVIDDQLVRIKRDLISQGLTYEELQDDILDHICCMVEDDLESGKYFETSYATTMSRIGEKTLSHLQHDTLLQLDYKFQRMKKITYVLGFTGSILAILGAFFKMMHWPGASILLMIGFMIVVLGFLPLYFISSYKEQAEKPNRVFPIVAYVTLLLVFTGAVFKIMHWPGAWLMLRISTVFILVGFLPLYIVQVFRKSSGKQARAAYIIMLLVGFSIVFILARVNISKFAIDRMIEMTELNEQAIELHKSGTQELLAMAPDSIKTDRTQAIVSSSDALESMANDMIALMLEKVNQPGASLEEVRGKDRKNVGRDAFLDNGLAESFKESVRKYERLLLGSTDDPILKSQLKLDFLFADEQWYVGWGYEDDVYQPLVVLYFKITEFKRIIIQDEYLVLKSNLD